MPKNKAQLGYALDCIFRGFIFVGKKMMRNPIKIGGTRCVPYFENFPQYLVLTGLNPKISNWLYGL